MNKKRTFVVGGVKIHYSAGCFGRNGGNRNYTQCILELEPNKYFSGVAVQHPKETSDIKTGWRISLKRACEAFMQDELSEFVLSHVIYRNLWSEIRTQLREQTIKTADVAIAEHVKEMKNE